MQEINQNLKCFQGFKFNLARQKSFGSKNSLVPTTPLRPRSRQSLLPDFALAPVQILLQLNPLKFKVVKIFEPFFWQPTSSLSWKFETFKGIFNVIYDWVIFRCLSTKFVSWLQREETLLLCESEDATRFFCLPRYAENGNVLLQGAFQISTHVSPISDWRFI